MNLPKIDPDEADRLSGMDEITDQPDEMMPVTRIGFKLEIVRLNRRHARVMNLVRMARTLSTDERTRKILLEAEEL